MPKSSEKRAIRMLMEQTGKGYHATLLAYRQLPVEDKKRLQALANATKAAQQ